MANKSARKRTMMTEKRWQHFTQLPQPDHCLLSTRHGVPRDVGRALRKVIIRGGFVEELNSPAIDVIDAHPAPQISPRGLGSGGGVAILVLPGAHIPSLQC